MVSSVSPQSNREQNSRLSLSAGLRLRNTEMTSSNADYRVVIFGAGGKREILSRNDQRSKSGNAKK